MDGGDVEDRVDGVDEGEGEDDGENGGDEGFRSRWFIHNHRVVNQVPVLLVLSIPDPPDHHRHFRELI